MNNLVAYVLSILIWGSTWIAIKWQIGTVPIEASIFYRFLLAASLMLFWCKFKNLSLKFTIKQHVALCGLGYFLFSTNYLFMYRATDYLVSGLASVIFSMASILNICNQRIFFGKKPQLQVIFGASLGVIGVITIFWQDIINITANSNLFLGITLGLIGAYCFSLGNMISSKNHQNGLAIIPSTTIAMIYGTIIMLSYLFIFDIPLVFSTEPLYLATLLYLSIPGSIIGFLCYLGLVGRIGPEKAGYAAVFFPLVALVISVFVENYSWGKSDTVGFILIAIGNFFVLSKKPLPNFTGNKKSAAIPGP